MPYVLNFPCKYIVVQNKVTQDHIAVYHKLYSMLKSTSKYAEHGPYGQQCISNEAKGGPGASTAGGSAWGGAVSTAAKDPNGNGLGDFRASGCGVKSASTSGQSGETHGNGPC